MPQYLILSKLTDEGRKTLKEKPERLLEVREELEAMNIKIIEEYMVLGPYDFVNIAEAPDNETIMKASVEIGSRGSVQVLTLPAIPVEKLVQAMAKS